MEKRNLLEAQNDYLSFNELIERHLANTESSNGKFVYKINSPEKEGKYKKRSKLSATASLSEAQVRVHSRFLKIKVKQQAYLGKPALAIYLSDYTDKVQDKLNNLVR